MSFNNPFYIEYSFRYDIERALAIKMLLHIFTDGLSHFDSMTRATVLPEKRLMIDLACVKNAYYKKENLSQFIYKIKK